MLEKYYVHCFYFRECRSLNVTITVTSVAGDWGSNASEWTVEKKSEWNSGSGDNWLDEFVEKNAAKKNSPVTSASAKTSSPVSWR